MTTKYIVNNVNRQTISGDITIDGNVIINGTTNTRPYNVYSSLLTQIGGSVQLTISRGVVEKGVTYSVLAKNPFTAWDFTNVGGPIYPENYSFVATSSDAPNNYGNASLHYNTGAPVVTVLENTIGNIWFTYDTVGNYSIYSNGLFTENKTTFSIILMGDDLASGYLCRGYIKEPKSCGIVTGDILTSYDDVLNFKTPIEIRVYN